MNSGTIGRGITHTPITGSITLDAIASAIERIEASGGTPTAIFMDAASWAVLRLLKDGDQRYQLAPDPSADTRKRLFGIDVFVSEFLGTSVAVCDMATIAFGLRSDVRIVFDSSRYLELDQTAVRLISRFDVGVLNVEGTQIIDVTATVADSKPATSAAAKK